MKKKYKWIIGILMMAECVIAYAASEDQEEKVDPLFSLFHFLEEEYESYFINQDSFPLVLSPKDRELPLVHFKSWAEVHQNELKDLLTVSGAILLRGFPVDHAEDFAAVIRAVIGKELIDYKGEGSRHRITQGVYTSTAAPPEFKIPLHNELTCTLNPVDYICFYCDIPPLEGTGQTILGRTEEVTMEMMKRESIWDLFYGKHMNYISRHPSEGNFFSYVNPTHRTWEQAFETADRNEVERICKESGYQFQWMDDWIEVVRCVPAILGPDQYFTHPYWFNQAHLYHMNPRLSGSWVNHLLSNLLYISSSTRPYDIEFEDGSSLPREIVYEIYDVLDQHTIEFSWEKGDVLILDNHKTLHGRAPCSTPRRILVAMVK